MPTGHFLSGPSSGPSARHLLVRPLPDACVHSTTLDQLSATHLNYWNRKSELSRVILDSRLSRVARSPVFYGRSRISDHFFCLRRGGGKQPGRTNLPYSVSRTVASLRRHCDTWKLPCKITRAYMAHLQGSSVLSIFAENSVRLSIGDLTTGLAFWHCAHSMRSRVYKTVRCPSVSQSVPSFERSSDMRRVCCWAPYAQKISINSASDLLHLYGIEGQVKEVYSWIKPEGHFA